ncbi:MAG: hypothetical protein JNN32_09955 [Flavobacteriales bacterium]|nr:hypothetical protein [Flavobacteriales bacterium]
MQTVLTIAIVLSAVAYVSWQWMPVNWRKKLVGRTSTARHGALPATLQQRRSSGCSACSTCGACSSGQLGS